MNHSVRNVRTASEKARARNGSNSSSEGQGAAEQPAVVMEKPGEHEPQSGPVLFGEQVLLEHASSAHGYTRALPHMTPFSAEQSSVASKRRSERVSSRAHTYAVETCGRRVHRMGLSAHDLSA